MRPDWLKEKKKKRTEESEWNRNNDSISFEYCVLVWTVLFLLNFITGHDPRREIYAKYREKKMWYISYNRRYEQTFNRKVTFQEWANGRMFVWLGTWDPFWFWFCLVYLCQFVFSIINIKCNRSNIKCVGYAFYLWGTRHKYVCNQPIFFSVWRRWWIIYTMFPNIEVWSLLKEISTRYVF